MEISANIIEVIGQSLLSAAVLFILAKLMGFKQLKQFNIFDYIVGITIGSIAATMAFEDNTPLFRPFIAMCIYAMIDIGISLTSMKSIRLRRFLNGTPVILMNKGKFISNNLNLVKLDINDFLSQARQAGFFDLDDIEAAVMEPSGMISFLPKSQTRPVCPRDLSLQPPESFVKPSLIIDGKVMKNNLAALGFDENWLINEMKKQNIDNVEEVFLGTLDENKNLLLFLKNEGQSKNTILE